MKGVHDKRISKKKIFKIVLKGKIYFTCLARIQIAENTRYEFMIIIYYNLKVND